MLIAQETMFKHGSTEKEVLLDEEVAEEEVAKEAAAKNAKR